jgi:hypothetical protein
MEGGSVCCFKGVAEPIDAGMLSSLELEGGKWRCGGRCPVTVGVLVLSTLATALASSLLIPDRCFPLDLRESAGLLSGGEVRGCLEQTSDILSH